MRLRAKLLKYFEYLLMMRSVDSDPVVFHFDVNSSIDGLRIDRDLWRTIFRNKLNGVAEQFPGCLSH